jgi:hypothetical protein
VAGTVVVMAQAGTVAMVAAVVVMVAEDMGAAMGTDGWIPHRAMERGNAPAVPICLARTGQS